MMRKIKWTKPDQNIREITVGDGISKDEWKQLMRKFSN